MVNTKHFNIVLTLLLLVWFSACSNQQPKTVDYESCIKGYWYSGASDYYSELAINGEYVGGINEVSMFEGRYNYTLENSIMYYINGEEIVYEVAVKGCDFEKLILEDEERRDTLYRYNYAEVFLHPQARKNYMGIDLDGEFFFRSAFYKEHLRGKE